MNSDMRNHIGTVVLALLLMGFLLVLLLGDACAQDTYTIKRGGAGFNLPSLEHGIILGLGGSSFMLSELPDSCPIEYSYSTQEFTCSSAGSGAPDDSEYWVSTLDANLSAEKVPQAGDGIDIDLSTATISNPYYPLSYDHRVMAVMFEEFNCGGNTYSSGTTTGKFFCESNWDYSLTSGGTVLTGVLTALSVPEGRRATQLKINGGTNATGSACVFKPYSFYVGGGSPGNGEITMEGAVALDALSNGTNRFGVTIGGTVQQPSTACNASTTELVTFFYRDDVSSGNWTCISKNAGTQTATDSTVAVAAETWYAWRIVINANGTSIDYFIDDTIPPDFTTPVCTITTNIPAGDPLGYTMQTLNAGGTVGDRHVYFDYFMGTTRFDSGR